jgi:hypothetical protein|tara:strand:+ start:1193 stop:1783 length:591 start_codon:yes stop_codon:yes gene_type:complete
MENYFKKLSAINVKGMAEKKGNFNYLSWANAWALIKENYPNAQRKVYESEQTELPYFTDGKTASVKVGITVNQIEHIDYLPVMDYRNNSIPIAKITSMDVNTAIQRSTAKAIAMHGLGIAIFKGEDLVNIATPKANTPAEPKKEVIYTLTVGDDNWDKVLNYISKKRGDGLEKIVQTLSSKYKISATTKKEIANHV